MKKILTILAVLLSMIPSMVFAAFPPSQVGQGGTGSVGPWNFYPLVGNATSTLVASSTLWLVGVNATSTTQNSTFVRFTDTYGTTTNATSTSMFSTTASSTNLFTSIFGIATTSPGSPLSIGGIANFTTATSTFYGNGLNITNGCFAINGTCLSSGGSGTVTSVALSVPSLLSISGSPITTSGTLAIGYSGTALPVANGGTNATTQTNNTLLWFNGTSITATSSQPLTVGSLIGTTTQTSYLNGAFGIASTSPKFGLSVTNGSILSTEYRPATSTAMTIDWASTTASVASNQQVVRLGSSATSITFANYVAGQTLRLIVCNGLVSGGALSWTTNILWPAGTAPTQTTTANKCDIWSFIATDSTSTSPTKTIIMGAQSANF